MNFDPFTLRQIDRLFSEARICFRIIDGRGVVYQIRQFGQTLFEGTKTETIKRFNAFEKGRLFGSELFELGAGV